MGVDDVFLGLGHFLYGAAGDRGTRFNMNKLAVFFVHIGRHDEFSVCGPIDRVVDHALGEQAFERFPARQIQ